jgi:IS1 family transposase
LCAVTKQVVAFVAGDRSTQTCRALWREIPWRYMRAKCYSDFWEAYSSVVPSDRHEAAGKESGKTNHVERWNNTLRQRLGQFMRKTLSFSKCWELHVARLKLFVHRYNLERANIILN